MSISSDGTQSGILAELLQAIASEECVLVLGGGVARELRQPTWRSVVTAMTERYPSLRELWSEPHGYHSATDFESMADLIVAELTQDQISSTISQQITTSPRPQWLRQLAGMPFRTIVSLNWDNMFEVASRARGRSLRVIEPSDSSIGTRELDAPDSVMIKVLGDVSRPEAMLLNLQQYQAQIDSRLTVPRYLRSVLATSPVLFVGLTPRGIRQLLASAEIDGNRSAQPRFALLTEPLSGGIDARILTSRHGITLLIDDASPRRDLIDRLVQSIVHRLPPALSPNRPRNKRRQQTLDRMRVRNLGRFEDLDVPLSSTTTLLLGDNGAGKSTLLRALALGLSGDEVAPGDGDGLLSEGASHGSIEIQVGANQYRTVLVRQKDGVHVRATTPTPVQTGQLLALGFPAIRGARMSPLTGPREERPTRDISPADLEPLRNGAPQFQLDELRQWLVNLAVRAEGRSQRDRHRALSTLTDVFRLLGRFTPGAEPTYAGLDTQRWDVLVNLAGTRVPLSGLSQGLLATLDWVGVLFRRLTEVNDGAITRGFNTLVLIDEIDAHLHPAWQAQLIPSLRDAFPRLQLVATTHSPLVVGSMDESGIVVSLSGAKGGDMQPLVFQGGFAGWRADQILTSNAFGLTSTRGQRATRDLHEYEQLLARPEPLDPVSRTRRDELAIQLGRTSPPSGETALERAAYESLQAALVSTVGEIPADERRAVVEEAKAYLRRIQGDA